MLRSLFAAACVAVATANDRVNNQITTTLWELIVRDQDKQGAFGRLVEFLVGDPTYAGSRSEDGRGAVFWAMESGNMAALALVKEVNDRAYELQMSDKDGSGKTPVDLCGKGKCEITDKHTEKVQKEISAYKKKLASILVMGGILSMMTE